MKQFYSATSQSETTDAAANDQKTQSRSGDLDPGLGGNQPAGPSSTMGTLDTMIDKAVSAPKKKKTPNSGGILK